MKLAWERDGAGDWVLFVTGPNNGAVICEMGYHDGRGWRADWPHLPLPDDTTIAGPGQSADAARAEVVRLIRECLRDMAEAVTLVEVQ